MDLRSLAIHVPATVILRRTIKWQPTSCPLSFEQSICLTPDTFHSDSASCHTRAGPLPQNMEKPQIGAAVSCQACVKTHVLCVHNMVFCFLLNRVFETKIPPRTQTHTAIKGAAASDYYQPVTVSNVILCPRPLPLLILLGVEGTMGGGSPRIKVQTLKSLLPKSFIGALQLTKPDFNLPDASHICSHEIFHSTIPTPPPVNSYIHHVCGGYLFTHTFSAWALEIVVKSDRG